MKAAGAALLAASVGKSVSHATLELFRNKIQDSTHINLSLSACVITAAGAAHLAEGVRKGTRSF